MAAPSHRKGGDSTRRDAAPPLRNAHGIGRAAGSSSHPRRVRVWSANNRVLSASGESSGGDQGKFVLDETQFPRAWYTLRADRPRPLPPVLHPGPKQRVGPADLEPLFPMALILQEVTAERYIDIPEPIRDIYRMWRPSPLMRAHRLEQKLGTPAKVYYKYEGGSPAGSAKPETPV